MGGPGTEVRPIAALIVDTRPLVALADDSDPHHERVKLSFRRELGPMYLPMLAISEAAHLIAKRGGPDAGIALIADIAVDSYSPLPVDRHDWPRIAELVHRYRDLGLGTVDASIVAAAERLDITRIATLDRRYFSVVRPRHIEAFEMLP